ncbi:MAG: hypothetical protein WBB46_07815 [Candidatus Deferrimicrobiaceae bacterium]
MKDYGKWAVTVAAGVCLLFTTQGPADAKPAYGKAEKKSCSFCHVGKTSDKVFTDTGKFYSKHHTLTGFGEETKAPAKAAPEPAPVPAATAEAPAGAEGAQMGKSMADSGTSCPCDCGCPCCMKKSCPHCGHAHGKGMMAPMREKMKGHLEEMRRAVSELRENERKMETMTEPEAFRAAVLEHLKILDGIQESHLRHMEKMIDARHGGKPGPPHMHSQ